ncbi:LAFE_0F17040g1_1 [Lachancea fermentati]|uniref:LAFE_0F17040g1_1 n=1 Tax=Lachancea fermentati TaxID=4955 RepID=A0A1G4MGI3_LACFM|nr:LAFE_0F17040g1_1 [Lachancea fermentati]
MSTDVEALFKEKSIPDIRDYNLEVSQEITRTRDEFNQQLRGRYEEILDVTHEVRRLLAQSKEVDSKLMDLCFNDTKYKLESISEVQLGSHKNSAGRSNENTYVENAQCILILTNWIQAVKVFMKDPCSSKNLDEVLAKFQTIESSTPDSSYSGMILKHCARMESFILEQKPAFNPLQWVKVHNLFHEGQNQFGFKHAEEIEALAYDALLTNEDLIHHPSSANIDPLVQNFIGSAVFKQRLIARFTDNIQQHFEKYEKARQITSEEIKVYQLSDERNLAQFVQNVNLYCFGFTNVVGQKLNDLIEDVIECLRNLKAAGADEKCMNPIKERIIALLDEEINTRQSASDEATICTEISENELDVISENDKIPEDQKNSVKEQDEGDKAEKDEEDTKKNSDLDSKTSVDATTTQAEDADTSGIDTEIESHKQYEGKKEMTNSPTIAENEPKESLGKQDSDKNLASNGAFATSKLSNSGESEVADPDASVESDRQNVSSPLTSNVAAEPIWQQASDYDPTREDQKKKELKNNSDGDNQNESLEKMSPSTGILIQKLISTTNQKHLAEYLSSKIEFIRSL